VVFDARNPWHRALRAWIFKTKCEKTPDAPQEEAKPPEEEVRPDETPDQVPAAEQIADSEAPPEMPDDTNE